MVEWMKVCMDIHICSQGAKGGTTGTRSDIMPRYIMLVYIEMSENRRAERRTYEAYKEIGCNSDSSSAYMQVIAKDSLNPPRTHAVR